jgi:hypothetical protein
MADVLARLNPGRGGRGGGGGNLLLHVCLGPGGGGCRAACGEGHEVARQALTSITTLLVCASTPGVTTFNQSTDIDRLNATYK